MDKFKGVVEEINKEEDVDGLFDNETLLDKEYAFKLARRKASKAETRVDTDRRVFSILPDYDVYYIEGKGLKGLYKRFNYQSDKLYVLSEKSSQNGLQELSEVLYRYRMEDIESSKDLTTKHVMSGYSNKPKDSAKLLDIINSFKEEEINEENKDTDI